MNDFQISAENALIRAGARPNCTVVLGTFDLWTSDGRAEVYTFRDYVVVRFDDPERLLLYNNEHKQILRSVRDLYVFLASFFSKGWS